MTKQEKPLIEWAIEDLKDELSRLENIITPLEKTKKYSKKKAGASGSSFLPLFIVDRMLVEKRHEKEDIQSELIRRQQEQAIIEAPQNSVTGSINGIFSTLSAQSFTTEPQEPTNILESVHK